MSTLSEQVQNQIRVSDKVVASVRAHSAVIANALAEQAKKIDGPQNATSEAYLAILGAIADTLSRAASELVDAEQALAAERADDAPIRASRDAAAGVLTALLGLLRRTIEDHLGAKANTQYGLTGEIPRVPAKLLQYSKNVVKLLDEYPNAVVSPLGSSFDTKVASQAVAKQCVELASSVEDDNREARELETALAQRDRAAAAWSEVYQGSAAALEGLYRLAGWKELADKVRPTQRKVRGEEAGEEIEVGETTAEPAGG